TFAVAAPSAHTVWMVFCVIFYGFWCATITVSFPKYGIYGASLYFVIFRFYLFFFGSCSGFRVIGNWETFLLKFGDGLSKLGNRGTNIWKFYDVCFRGFGEFT